MNAAVAAVRDAGGEAAPAPGDVSSSEDVQSVLRVAKDAFGGLDILYNNAGIGYSATSRMGVGMADIVNTTEDDWRRIIDINLGGIFLFCKYGIPMLIEWGGGVVINDSLVRSLGIGDRTGRIAEGYEADLVLVPGNPLEDVRVLQDPLLVISNGEIALSRIPFALPDDAP